MMKTALHATAILLALLMLFSAFPATVHAIDSDNVITMQSFEEDADYALVKFADFDNSDTYYAFIDEYGRFACYTDADNLNRVVAMAGPYIAFSPLFPANEYYVADISACRIIFASSQNTKCDQVLDIACWQENCYILGHSSFAGFDAVGEIYSIFDGNGRTVFEKTYSKTINTAKYIGEGWFILAYNGGALYTNAVTGKTYDFVNALNWTDGVCNGYTYNSFRTTMGDRLHCVDLNTGTTTQIDLPESNFNSVYTGAPSENKMVAFEHNAASVGREKMRSVFYYTPGKGINRITTWADHVFDSSIAFQFGFCKFVNGKLLLPMEGADRAYYVGLIDENGRQLVQPIKTDCYRSYAATDGRIVVRQDGIDTVYDDQGNLLFYATDFGKTTIEPYSHGFARIGESGGTWVLIDRDGNLLLSELYVDQDSMPRLDLY